MNLQFKISEKESNFEELKLELGIKNFNKNNITLCRDMVISKIKKVLDLSFETEEFILTKFFELLNEDSLMELMYLNLSTFDNNISKDKANNSTLRNLHAFESKLKDLKENSGTLITGLAFIFKFDKKIKKKFNLLKNSIIIYADFCYEKEADNSDTKLWFDITRIESMEFSYESVDSLNIKTISNLIDTVEFLEKNEIDILKLYENKEDFFNLFKSVSRSDILTAKSEEGLNLRGWHDFIIDFKRYLRDKKRVSSQAKLFSLKDFSLEENTNVKDNLILMIDSKTKISEGKYKIISSERDDIKTTTSIKSLSDFDINEYINQQITIFNEKITLNLEKIKLEENKINKLLDEKQEYKITLREYEKNLEDEQSNNKRVVEEEQKVKEEILNVEKNIDIFEKSNKKNKKIKKDKTSDNLKNNQVIQELKQDLQIFKENLKNISLYVAKTVDQLKLHNKKITKIKDKMDLLDDKLNKLNSSKEDLNEDILSFEKEISDYNNFKSNIELSTASFKKVSLKTDPRDDEEKIINFNEIELSSLLKNDYKGKQIWYLSDFDQGLLTKINRYYSAIVMLEKGIYRNPYLATSLEYPELIRVNKFPVIDLDNINLNLNSKQYEALEMALTSNSLSYLQGPPGTGKTQTIAAITYLSCKKNENTLITSFSHEAINNAFDRLKDFFKIDPNIIFYKNTYIRDKEEELSSEGYDYKHMYQNFLYSIDNFILKDFNNQDSDEFNSFSEQYNFSKGEINFVPTFLMQMIKSQEYDKYNLKNYKWIYSESMAKNLEEEIKEAITYGGSKEEVLDSKTIILERKYEREIKNYITLDKQISKFIEKYGNFKSEEIVSIDKIIETIIKKINVNSEKTYINKIKNLNKNLKNRVNNSTLNKNEVETFALTALNKELINVIGITTTGKQSITYLNETRDLFIEYPVNFEIIDEVSKSTTIEILNTALLADKIMLAGDYRQLPPNLSDIDESTLKKYFQWKTKKDADDKANESEFKIFRTKIEKLFLFPLFKNHAQKLKGIGDKAAYKFLNIQHRFNEEIMDIVNFVYDEEEKLQLPSTKRNELIVKLNYDKTYSNAVNILDTSYISEKFIKYVKENSKYSQTLNIFKGQVSFDQKISLFNNRSLGSAFNEYNAYCIVELVKKIKEDVLIKPDQIGIIAVTKSQKIIIRDMLRENIKDNNYLNQIKIDTVDNFQGREKDIIIVDLVRGKQLLTEDRIFRDFKSRNIDFYKSIERLNVAVSRARHKLIIVGAVEDYFRSEVKPLIDNEKGEQTPLNIFDLWFEKVEDNEGVIRTWKI